MKRLLCLLFLFAASGLSQAGELSISAREPLVITAPDSWKAVQDRPADREFPFETYRILPPNDRNAVALISIVKKTSFEFTDRDFVVKFLRAECRPYVISADELKDMKIQDLRVAGGIAVSANFVDPSLTNAPIKKGTYKTATPIIITLGTQYLIKATILVDDLRGDDFHDLIKIITSVRIKKD